MRIHFYILCVVTLFIGLAYADRTVWYVHPDSALNTIQAGLDSCHDNDIVLVGPGTYYNDYTIVWPNTQGIHLISELGPDVTIIRSNAIDAISIDAPIDTTTLIKGFTIQNGEGEIGFHILYTALKIYDNYITDNQTAGIWAHGAGGSILKGNIIANNGVGIVIQSGCLELIDNIVSYNEICGLSFSPDPPNFKYLRQEINGNIFSHNGGFGIDLFYGALKNAIITHNGSGGIHLITGADIDSCTIAHNNGPGVTNFAGPCIAYRERQISYVNYCDIFDNINFGIQNLDTIWINAEYNWWGDSTGPYHPDSNPGGLGDTVSDYVDFIPWLYWPGVEERPSVSPVVKRNIIGATIFAGPLLLPEGKKCKVFDITGRVVMPDKIKPGIYFVEIDGVVTQKVVKVR